VALMAEHGDARQASRQCARTCGALVDFIVNTV